MCTNLTIVLLFSVGFFACCAQEIQCISFAQLISIVTIFFKTHSYFFFFRAKEKNRNFFLALSTPFILSLMHSLTLSLSLRKRFFYPFFTRIVVKVSQNNKTEWEEGKNAHNLLLKAVNQKCLSLFFPLLLNETFPFCDNKQM